MNHPLFWICVILLGCALGHGLFISFQSRDEESNEAKLGLLLEKRRKALKRDD